MIELSKNLYNAMATILCQSPYLEKSKCLCPDKISFSLFLYVYYKKFEKNKMKQKIRLKFINGYFKVTFKDNLDKCSKPESFSDNMELTDFNISEIQKELLCKFSLLSEKEQVFLINDLAVLRTIRLRYESNNILYEDVQSLLFPFFATYKLSIIVMIALSKISKKESCEDEILTIIEIDKRKAILEEDKESFQNQKFLYCYHLLKKLRSIGIKRHFPDLTNSLQREDPINKSDEFNEEIIKILYCLLKKYRLVTEMEYMNSHFQNQYALDDSIDNLSGEMQEDIKVSRNKILECQKKAKLLICTGEH